MPPDRDKYRNILTKPTADDKVKKVFLVSKQFYKKLELWVKDSKTTLPKTLDNDKLYMKLPNAKLDEDFCAVTNEVWSQILKDFKKPKEIQKYLIKNPTNGSPTIIMKPTKVEIEMPTAEKKKKLCEEQWLLCDVAKQLCRANGLDPSEYKVVNSGTNKPIGSTLTVKDAKSFSFKLKIVKQESSKKLSSTAILPSKISASKIPIIKKRETPKKVPILSPKCKTVHNLDNKRNINKIIHNLDQIPVQTDENNTDLTDTLQNDSLTRDENILASTYSGNKEYIHKDENNFLSSGLIHKEALPPLKKETDFKKVYSSTGVYPNPVGLNNLGNTCYFNSAMQCLIRVKPLTDFIMSKDFESHINTRNKKGSGGRIAMAYRDFIKQMSTGSSAKNPSAIRSAIVSKYRTFANFSQHDSQELLGAILDGLHEDLNQAYTANGNRPEIKVDENTDSWTRHLARNYSPIVDIFHGEFFSNTECPKCNYISSVHDPFMFISVPIPRHSYGSVKLHDCLASFEQVDKLDADNKWKCEKCKEKVCATKRIGIFRCSQVLIIHLKRFSGTGYFSSKIDTEVIYPDVLDTSSYVSQGHGAKYQLIGAVFHSGSLNGGHYTSSALDQNTNRWYHFNDSFASSIDIASAHSRNAYILFYQKLNY